MGFYITVSFRVVFISFKIAGWDEQGVIQELLMIVGIVGGSCLLFWILVIIDPSSLAYLRIFSWTWLFPIVGLLYWYSSFGLQLYVQLKQDYHNKTSVIQIADMKATCADDPQVKQEFYEFAKKHYVVESINFLDDVASYKSFFFDKVSLII